MGRPRESFNKKDREKAILKKRKDKEQRKEERKANSGKGKGLESMIAYVDAYGNITSTPPDPKVREEIRMEDIQISPTKKESVSEEPAAKTGIVTFYNESKGYGFIKELDSNQSIFFHVRDIETRTTPIKEQDRVSFFTERGPRGLNATQIRIL